MVEARLQHRETSRIPRDILPTSSRKGYPEKTITLVIPSTAGGITDLTGRLWAETLEKYLKQPVVVVKKLEEVARKISEDKDFQNKAKNMAIQLDYKDTASFEKYILRYKEGIQTFFKEEGLVK